MDSLTGRLLVASPDLIDSNFKRTVIYLCSHGTEGALGLILNRPLDGVPVESHLPEWGRTVSEPRVLFRGGPVERESVFALARSADLANPETQIEGWIPAANGLGLVNIGAGPETLGFRLDDARVFLGYAGWSEGQLDSEVGEGAWFPLNALPGDIFTATPETLYRDVLARQPGRLAMYALFPDNPRQN
jgi:putative transcriptional regulator